MTPVCFEFYSTLKSMYFTNALMLCIDFCVWDPDAELTVTQDIVQFQNKANPYMGRKLNGVVHTTIVRGLQVFQDGENFQRPMGDLIERTLPGRKRIVKIDAEE